MKNILVAIDFTGTVNELIDAARDLGRHYKAKVWLVHVAPPMPEFIGYEVGPKYIRDHRAKELREEHRQLQHWAEVLDKSDIDTEALLVEGPTVDTLLEEAIKLDADLIVIATRKHGFLYEQFIGSTFKEVAARTTVPLFVVPIHEKPA